MGDVISITEAKGKRKGKASKKATDRIEGGKIAQAFAKYGHINGTEIQKKRLEWLNKEEKENEDDTHPFTDWHDKRSQFLFPDREDVLGSDRRRCD